MLTLLHDFHCEAAVKQVECRRQGAEITREPKTIKGKIMEHAIVAFDLHRALLRFAQRLEATIVHEDRERVPGVPRA